MFPYLKTARFAKAVDCTIHLMPWRLAPGFLCVDIRFGWCCITVQYLWHIRFDMLQKSIYILLMVFLFLKKLTAAGCRSLKLTCW